MVLILLQDLKECANTIIGDETAGHKGISGGQRRRVGIGLQLVRFSECIRRISYIC